jgi:hypothetical protein
MDDVVATHDRKPTILVAVYLIGTLLTAVNYIGFMRFQEGVYSFTVVKVYLGFTIAGGVFFVLGAAVLWLWASRYSFTHHERMRKTALGIFLMMFAHDGPLFTIELVLMWCCGWRSALQGVCFIYQCFSFTVSFGVCWYFYAIMVAEWLEQHYGWGDEYRKLVAAHKGTAVLEKDLRVGGGGGFGKEVGVLSPEEKRRPPPGRQQKEAEDSPTMYPREIDGLRRGVDGPGPRADTVEMTVVFATPMRAPRPPGEETPGQHTPAHGGTPEPSHVTVTPPPEAARHQQPTADLPRVPGEEDDDDDYPLVV